MTNKKLREFWKKIKTNKCVDPVSTNQFNYEKIINYKSKNKKLIEIKNLSMSYHKFPKKTINIFNDLNFDIYANEITAIIGSNGAGKTTIVDIISGIKKATNGEVKFNYQTQEIDKIGVQFQDLSFPKGLTVKDMLNFELSLSKKIDPLEFDQILETFRLKQLLKMQISKLSGGQQQRLNVIISLMNKPKVIFLDEFTTGLDIAIKNEIKNFIVDFCKRNKIAIVLISHDIDIIDELVEHFIVIANKKIIVDTNRATIIKKYKNISNFLRKYIN